MAKRSVNTVLVASGSGTDAEAIMKAYASGCIPNINLVALISTKQGAGCIEKALNLGVQHIVVARKGKTLDSFNDELRLMLSSLQAELVFLVGCIVKVYPIEGMAIYNIHPADPHKHGGDNMYGPEVHRRVIREVEDLIRRGKKQKDDRFFSYPTIHEAVLEYDSGEILIQGCVEIPSSIITRYMEGEIKIDEAAGLLQKTVLPYEWIILPPAVQMAAKKIIDERG